MKRSFKLRLRCRDEAKGPVTAVCGIDGYLVSSMGQKVDKYSRAMRTPLMLLLLQIFVRAFDLDERLVGVAFLDVGVYVTTMRSLKNLLIVGDAVKSVWFVAFQVRLLQLQAAKRIVTEMAGNIGRSIQTRCFGEGSSQGLRNCY
jgi:cleavage and polyadenylation specificity factor subunit 1